MRVSAIKVYFSDNKAINFIILKSFKTIHDILFLSDYNLKTLTYHNYAVTDVKYNYATFIFTELHPMFNAALISNAGPFHTDKIIDIRIMINTAILNSVEEMFIKHWENNT